MISTQNHRKFPQSGSYTIRFDVKAYRFVAITACSSFQNHTIGEREIERDRERETERDTERETERERERDRERERQRQRHRERERQRERESKKLTRKGSRAIGSNIV